MTGIALLCLFRVWLANRLTKFFMLVVSLDRHHFDNPVYSYQTPATKGDDGTNLLLNNVQKIRNDLGASKNNTNLERQKLGVGCSEEDDDISMKGATEHVDPFSMSFVLVKTMFIAPIRFIH